MRYFYSVLDENDWSDTNNKFDVVTCLNVLDRCEKPLTLLQDIKKVLKHDNGIAVVAFVIPYAPFVEFGKHILRYDIFKNSQSRIDS